MKPPRMPIEECCACPDGRHVRRFLPQPETAAERVMIEVYDQAYVWPDEEDLREAIERFMDPTRKAENILWAADFEERSLNRKYP